MKRNRNGRYQSAGELKSLVYGPNNELYLARVQANLMNWLGDPKQTIDEMMERIEGEANAIEGEFTKEGSMNGKELQGPVPLSQRTEP